MYPAEPRIGLDVRISLKYSEYQIFLQKCAEYQILSETPYLLNFLAHTKIYLSSWSKTDLGALLIVIHVTTNPLCLENNFSTTFFSTFNSARMLWDAIWVVIEDVNQIFVQCCWISLGAAGQVCYNTYQQVGHTVCSPGCHNQIFDK